jgi:3-hydroxybutyrate dehydrogenase
MTEQPMLKGKVALITGSTGGIGFATARSLAAESCNVMLNGFADADAVAARINELQTVHKVKAVHDGADLATPEGAERLIAATLHAFGRIDILVNNAVVRHFSPIEAFAVDDWNKALAVNLSAPFHAIRLALPHMKAAGWGRIVNIASIFGFFAVPDRVDYVTTKTALIGLSRAVAVEALPFGVTCNAICPGTVLTPATRDRVAALARRENLTPEEASKTFLAGRQPSARFIDEESVAGLVMFLCGPHSRDITGASLPIDAGWHVGR